MYKRLSALLFALSLLPTLPASAQTDTTLTAFTVTPVEDGWYRISMEGVDGAIRVNRPDFHVKYPKTLQRMFARFEDESSLETVNRYVHRVMRELIEAMQDEDATLKKTRAMAVGTRG